MKTQHTFLLKLFALSLTGCLATALVPVSTAWADPPLRTVRVSVSSTGAQGNGNSSDANLAAYGRFVAFTSSASNLVAGDNNGLSDIFVRDFVTGRTKRVSVSSAGSEGNGVSRSPLISANGRYVAFLSDAGNLAAGDNNGKTDLFVHDTQTGVTRRVFLDDVLQYEDDPFYGRTISLGNLSDNGRFVAFGAGLDNGGAYVSDLKTGMTQLVGISGASYIHSIPALSGDGRFVANLSYSSPCPGDGTAVVTQVHLRDLKTGVDRCVLTTDNYNVSYFNLTLSADGRFLAHTFYDFEIGETDVFVENVNTLVSRLVSVNRTGIAGNGNSSSNDLSANGRFVAFGSLASDLVTGDNNGTSDVFVRDLKAGVTRRVSIDSLGRQGNKGSSGASLSADGRMVAFSSNASNLVARDTNGKTDVFVRLWRR